MTNITLSVDERVVREAREAAQAMGKSLNQVVREYLEQLAGKRQMAQDIEDLRRLSDEAHGHSRGWKFNRDEIYERR
jgi:antitoxin component of RelBE/YafQ-DinJ toxin-antitoxin module